MDTPTLAVSNVLGMSFRIWLERLMRGHRRVGVFMYSLREMMAIKLPKHSGIMSNGRYYILVSLSIFFIASAHW